MAQQAAWGRGTEPVVRGAGTSGTERAGSTDWTAWHADYDDPGSSLSRRRREVQGRVEAFLDRVPGEVRVVSACAGDGRDLLEVLARRPDAARVGAVLVEADPSLAQRARDLVARHDLRVEVRTGDAGTSDAYAGAVPADLVMLCGVFGNVTADDVRSTVAAVPALAAAGATVLWTRGRFDGADDVVPTIDGWFVEEGCTRTFLAEEATYGYRVVEHRFDGTPRPLEPGRRLFTFVV